MNEQLLLSKAFWRNDEFDDAIQSIVKMNNSIYDKKWDEITKEDCLKYLDSIEIAIESMPMYVGVFNSSSGINYRGFTYRDLVEVFALYVFTKLRYGYKGKESVLKPIFDTTSIILDDYVREYASAYEISAFTKCSYNLNDLEYNLRFLRLFYCDPRWRFYNEDGRLGFVCFYPVVTIKDGKLGIIQNKYIGSRKIKLNQNCEAHEEYFKSHPECRDKYNEIYKKLDNIHKKKDEREKKLDELREKEESYYNEIKELNEKIKNNNEEIIGLNKKLIKGKATKQRIEELNSEIESLKKEVDNITEAKENASDQWNELFDITDQEFDDEMDFLTTQYQLFLEENDGLIEYEWRD